MAKYSSLLLRYAPKKCKTSQPLQKRNRHLLGARKTLVIHVKTKQQTYFRREGDPIMASYKLGSAGALWHPGMRAGGASHS